MFTFLVLSGLLATALGQYHSHCNTDCSQVQGYAVCGSNHVTYANLCEFSVASCIENEIHSRPLRYVRGPCSTTTSAPPVDTHCNDICDEDFHPVCASDGVVYDNKCKFLRAKCEAAKMNVTLFPISLGDSCPTFTTPDCTKYRLDVSDLALEEGSNFSPRCPPDHNFVCASDGQSYTNECQLCSYLESHPVKLQIVSNGHCLI